MEDEKKPESIFEQENYDGGFGSGPLASAPDEDDNDSDATEESDDNDRLDEDLDLDA